MWTAQEFAGVLERHPNGGTLWTRTHRMMRYVRVCRPGNGIIVAIMTEIWRWRGKGTNKVELFVRIAEEIQVVEFPKAEKSLEFLGKLLTASILEKIEDSLLPEVKKFISTPDKTYLYTW